jgi:predicted PurR-regulated permease PerM
MQQFPLTVRRSIELVGLCAVAFVISAWRDLITPLMMAFFLAILLLPVYRFLRKRRFPEILAITCSIILAALVVAGVVWFFSMQVSGLVRDFPQIQENLNSHWQQLSNWINRKTNFSGEQQLELLRNQSNKLMENAGSVMGGAAVSLSSVFIFVGLLPIYTFLVLYYKDLLLRFTFFWFRKEDHARVADAVKEMEVIIKSYLVGLLIQITYMTVLLGGILMIIGIKHALLIGVIFAILNLIPYIGALIGNIIGVLLTLTSSQELWPVITVLAVIAAVQFLDNNILMPRIVGGKVRINALVSLVGVVIGGMLAGVAGMFLSLPVMAVLKIIFDRTEAFRHWGVVLGDERPKASPMSFRKLTRRPRRNTTAGEG